jgi:apolipoprotein N-acyltransferase
METSYQKPSMERYLYLSQAHRDAQIIIWPETAIPMFYHDIPAFYPSFLEKLAQEVSYHTDFLIGMPVLNQQDNTYYNALASFGQQPGFLLQTSFSTIWRIHSPCKNPLAFFNLLEVPFSEFTAGAAKQDPLYSAGEPIGISICYEEPWTLSPKPRSANHFLVNISNDAWFGDSIAPIKHLENCTNACFRKWTLPITRYQYWYLSRHRSSRENPCPKPTI